MPRMLIITVLLAFAVSYGGDDFIVVVNKDNALTEITKADLKRLFTGKKSDIGTVKAVPMNQTLESSVAAGFLASVVGMSADEYREYWVAEQVKGGGAAPMIQKSSESVVAMVSQLPGGIGYVDKSANTGSVKVLTVK